MYGGGCRHGNYGTCLLVREVSEGVLYALKRIPIGKKEESRAALREAQVLSSLTHPNVIAYKESFLHEGNLCIVTSYCEEGDLFTRYAERCEVSVALCAPATHVRMKEDVARGSVRRCSGMPPAALQR